MSRGTQPPNAMPIPAGMVTGQMADAGRFAYKDHIGGKRGISREDAAVIYRAMLAAAPKVVTQSSGEAVQDAIVAALKAERDKPLQGPTHGVWDRGRDAGLDAAIRIASLSTTPTSTAGGSGSMEAVEAAYRAGHQAGRCGAWSSEEDDDWHKFAALANITDDMATGSGERGPDWTIERDADGEAMVCTGCGTTRTVEHIRYISPKALTCCPERKMIPVRSALHPSKAPTNAGEGM